MHIEKVVRTYANETTPNGRPIMFNAWEENLPPANQSISLKALPGAIEYVCYIHFSAIPLLSRSWALQCALLTLRKTFECLTFFAFFA